MASHSVRVGNDVLTIDDSDFEVEPVGNGIYVVSDASSRYRVVVAGPPGDRWVFVDGQVERVEVVTAATARSRRRSTAHDMTAPMPATVVKVLVEPGSVVEKGSTVVMLEAMKMELPVRAARSGVVQAVHCTPGELVQPGVPLVEIEG